MMAFLKAAGTLVGLSLGWAVVDRAWQQATGREQRPECGACGCAAPCERKAGAKAPR